MDFEEELLAELCKPQHVHVSPAVACFEIVNDLPTDLPEMLHSLMKRPKIFSFECYVDVPRGSEEAAKSILLCLAVFWRCSMEGGRADFYNDQRPAVLFLHALRHTLELSFSGQRRFLLHLRRTTAGLMQLPLV